MKLVLATPLISILTAGLLLGEGAMAQARCGSLFKENPTLTNLDTKSIKRPTIEDLNRAYLPFQEMKNVADVAVNVAYNRLLTELNLHHRDIENASLREQPAIRHHFLEVLSQVLSDSTGGRVSMFHFIDTPKSFSVMVSASPQAKGLNDTQFGRMVTLPLFLLKPLVTDHHTAKYGDYFLPDNPKNNTTLQFIGSVERTLRNQNGDVRKASEEIRKRYGVLSTDNMADSIEVLFMYMNIETFLKSPSLLRQMKIAAYFTDFGVFGGKDFEKLVDKDFRNKFSEFWSQYFHEALEVTDAEFRAGIDIAKANLQIYGEIISRPEFGGFFLDRIHVTADQKPRPDQTRIVKMALDSIYYHLTLPEYRNQLVKRFDADREKAAFAVKNEHRKLVSDMKSWMSHPSEVPQRPKSRTAERDVELIRLAVRFLETGGYVYPHYQPKGLGLFPAWAGPGTAHKLPVDLNIAAYNAKENTINFILSNLDGRENTRIDFMQFRKYLYEEILSTTMSKSSPEEIEAAQKFIGGRQMLLFTMGNKLQLHPARLYVELLNYLDQIKVIRLQN